MKNYVCVCVCVCQNDTELLMEKVGFLPSGGVGSQHMADSCPENVSLNRTSVRKRERERERERGALKF